MTPPGIEPIVEDLLNVLDNETKLLELKRSQLADLSEKLLRNDNEAVETLLEQIESTEELQVLMAHRLQKLRQTLAGAFGRPADGFKLAWLIDQLPHAQAMALTASRQRVSEKVIEFRKQHLETTIFLRECSRITGMMLDTLAPSSSTTTYDAEGPDRWRAEAGLLDMER
jgi:flagellar biosynthesis/type III secretory pathway chaperone